MAGLSGGQVVVDVVALSETLVPGVQPSAGPAEKPEPAAVAPEEAGTACPLGHLNAAEARFCSSCGLAMDATLAVPGQPSRPKPAAELTPEERALREQQHQAALAETARFETVPPQYEPAAGEGVLIHFIEDGLTAFGQIWYRGQELQIGPDHPRWAEALGWITLNRMEQVERWGRQFFEPGPWPGRNSYADALGSFEQRYASRDADGKLSKPFAGPSEDQLRSADEAERRRGRGVPAPAVFG
jgi:hypothetical protein